MTGAAGTERSDRRQEMTRAGATERSDRGHELRHREEASVRAKCTPGGHSSRDPCQKLVEWDIWRELPAKLARFVLAVSGPRAVTAAIARVRCI